MWSNIICTASGAGRWGNENLYGARLGGSYRKAREVVAQRRWWRTGKPVRGKPVMGKPVMGKPVRGKPVRGKPVSGRLRMRLSWANLSGANLSGAKNQIYIGQRSDGYQFFARHDKEKSAWIISAGCRYFTPNEYRTHAQKYNCGTKRAETLALIDFAEIQIKIRGVVEVGNE
jgi:hypothetical protein